MSADNGYIIRRNSLDQYVLQMYFASNDTLPPIEDAPEAMHFGNLSAAIMDYQKFSDTEYWSEYGLTVSVKNVTPNTNQKRNYMPTVETTKYIRKPFEVEAVQITSDNIEALAAWCGGVVVRGSKKIGRHIEVEVKNPQTERQTKGFLNDWLLYSASGWKVYTPRAFEKSFEQSSNETVMHVVETPEPALFELSQPVQSSFVPVSPMMMPVRKSDVE